MVCIGSCEPDSESYDHAVRDDCPHEHGTPDLRVGLACEPGIDHSGEESEWKCDEKSLLWVKVSHKKKLEIYRREYIGSS